MRSNQQRMIISMFAIAAISACALAMQGASTTAAKTATASGDKSRGTVIISITTGPEDVFRLLSAFHVAEDAINDGRHVVLFFNGRGVTVPLKRLSSELQLGRERSLWLVLNDLVAAGAEVLVPRETIRELNMDQAEFIKETQFGEWGGSVFCKVQPNTVVFSY